MKIVKKVGSCQKKGRRPNSLSTMPHSLDLRAQERRRQLLRVEKPRVQASFDVRGVYSTAESDINRQVLSLTPLSGRYAELCWPRPKSVSCLENLSKLPIFAMGGLHEQ